MEKLTYKEVMDRGFEREEDTDSVFFDQYGFEYFRVEKKLAKRISLEWDVNEHTVRAVRIDREGFILGEIRFETIHELDQFIAFYEKKKI